jgi:hypothetical protein
MWRTAMKKLVVFGVVMFLVSGFVLAQQTKDFDITGKMLLDKMNSSNASDKDYVRGYITGVYSASRNLSSIPDDSTVKKAEKIAKKYLKKNPKMLNHPAGELLIEAWNQALPIKKK